MQTPIAPPTAPAPTSTTTTAAPATSAPAATVAPLPSGSATIPNLSPSLAQALQSGTTLAAQVSTPPQNGQLALTLQGGQTLQVQTALPLPAGTNLAVTLQSLGPPATVLLQPQSQGQVPNQGAATTAQTAQTATAQAGSSPAVVTTLTQGSVLTATVTGPPNQTAAAQFGTSAGTVSGSAPAGQATAGAATQGTPNAAALPPGTVAQLRVLNLAPQGQPLPQSLGQAQAPGGSIAGSFTGVVSGQGGGGSVSLQTPLGTMSITVPNPPPNGTQLLLSQVGDLRLPAGDGSAATAAGPRYQALQDALALLQSTNSTAAQRLGQSLIPQPNAQFGLAALFLANAMRQGGLDRWLGSDTTRALTAAGARKSGLLSRLEGDIASSTSYAKDASGQEWRVSTLPFLSDGQVDQIRLYLRDRGGDPDEAGEDAQKEFKRFVIEANFSRLGPIQLDGLARDKQVDVMVRSQLPLEETAREEIRALFADTVSAMGLQGRIEFSTVPEFDLFPESDNNAPGPGGLTI